MIQKIKLTDGCPNQCAFCYEQKEMHYYPIPEIKEQHVQILDMNFLANPDHMQILHDLPIVNTYELVCGVDHRFMTTDVAHLLKKKRFVKIRWAWDYNFSQQKHQREVLKMFLNAGYKAEELSVFMIVNWKIPFPECMKKLDLLKVWNVKVNDCCYDGGYKLAKPIHWSLAQIKAFRKICRKHNQMVRFKIDPEYSEFEKEYASISSSEKELKLI